MADFVTPRDLSHELGVPQEEIRDVFSLTEMRLAGSWMQATSNSPTDLRTNVSWVSSGQGLVLLILPSAHETPPAQAWCWFYNAYPAADV